MASLLTKNGQAILSSSKTIVTLDSGISTNQQFIQAVRAVNGLQEQIDGFWNGIKNSMEQYDIDKLTGDWGYIQFVETTGFKGEASPRFMKRVLDTGKVRAYEKMYAKLPSGITKTATRYFKKSIKPQLPTFTHEQEVQA